MTYTYEAIEDGQSLFEYGQEEIDYLKGRDKRLAEIIDKIGPIERPCMDDPYEAVVNAIIGQQIATKAHKSIWRRIKSENGRLTPENVIGMGPEKLQAYGTTWRKVDYIMDFSEKIISGEFDIEALRTMDDDEAIAELSSLRGIGEWTAEMILLFCFRRPNILSYGDLAVLRGMRMVYRHRELTRDRFERYRRRLSPYCSVASLYFWAVAGGAIPELTDPGAKKKAGKTADKKTGKKTGKNA